MIVKYDKVSLELFYAMLGYLSLLDLVSLLVTFPTCRLPDTFNEAEHITLSMLSAPVSGCPSYLPTCMPIAKTPRPWRSFSSWHQEEDSCPPSSFPNATSSFSILKRTQKNTKDQMFGWHYLKWEKLKWTMGSVAFSGMPPWTPHQEDEPSSEPHHTGLNPSLSLSCFYFTFHSIKGRGDIFANNIVLDRSIWSNSFYGLSAPSQHLIQWGDRIRDW